MQHCKMVIVDNNRAVVLGSPFSQRYFDSLFHRIEDPRRGGNTSDIVHDLSMAVVGPAARDLFETFRLYWNEDLPEAPEVASVARISNPIRKPCRRRRYRQSAGGANTQWQALRTGLKSESEKGILEGYLRAFAAAKHYIYLENQYFTDCRHHRRAGCGAEGKQQPPAHHGRADQT